MKTPREILLNRHRSAESKLDAVRETALAATFSGSERNASQLMEIRARLPIRFAQVLWRELFLPCRGIWAALVAVWMVILVMNLPGGVGSTPRFAAKSTSPDREARALLFEQREMLTQFIESTPPSPVITRRTSAPHSEIPQTITFV